MTEPAEQTEMFDMPMEGKTQMVRGFIEDEIQKRVLMAQKYPDKYKYWMRRIENGRRALRYFDDIEQAAMRHE